MAAADVESLFRLVECPICTNEYDEKEFLPKLIPVCHHTVCVGCLQALLSSGKPCCPICREVIRARPGMKSSEMKTNTDVFDKLTLIAHMKNMAGPISPPLAGDSAEYVRSKEQKVPRQQKSNPLIRSLLTKIQDSQAHIEREEVTNARSRETLMGIHAHARDTLNASFSHYTTAVNRAHSIALASLSHQYKEEESGTNELTDHLVCQRLRLSSLRRQLTSVSRGHRHEGGAIEETFELAVGEEGSGAIRPNGELTVEVNHHESEHTDASHHHDNELTEDVVRRCTSELPDLTTLTARTYEDFQFEAVSRVDETSPAIGNALESLIRALQETSARNPLRNQRHPDELSVAQRGRPQVGLGAVGRRRSLSHSDALDEQQIREVTRGCEPQFPTLRAEPTAPPSEDDFETRSSRPVGTRERASSGNANGRAHGQVVMTRSSDAVSSHSRYPGSPKFATRHGSLMGLHSKPVASQDRRPSSMTTSTRGQRGAGVARGQKALTRDDSLTSYARHMLRNILLINEPQLKFGQGGSREGEFNKPYAVSCFPESGDILIADCNNLRLQRFTQSGEFISSFSHGYRATDVAILDESRYVFPTSRYMGGRADASDTLVLAADGNIIHELRLPRAKSCCHVATLYRNHLVALDYATSILYIIRLTSEGQRLELLHYVPLPVKANPYSYVARGQGSDVFVSVRDCVIVIDLSHDGQIHRSLAVDAYRKIGTKGEGLGEFRMAGGIVVEPESGLVFVSDYCKSIVQAFTYDGVFIGSITSQGDRMHLPNGLALTPDSHMLLVADMNNHCIKGFGINE